MMKLENIPKEIDYSLFKWLKRGDYDWIAGKAKVSTSTVGATIRKESFNSDVILWATKKAMERMEPVLQQQAEAKRIQQSIEIRKAS